MGTPHTTIPSTTTEVACHAQLATIATTLEVDAPFPTTVNVSTATNISAAYEIAYMTATNDPPDGISTSIQDTATTKTAAGQLVRLDAVHGGSYVIEHQPRPAVTKTATVTEPGTPTPATTVVFVDDFYSIYYVVTGRYVIRLEREHSVTVTPTAPPSLETALATGDLLACREVSSTTAPVTTGRETANGVDNVRLPVRPPA
jgi:hypothetical protein